MKIFFRLLGFSRPYHHYIPEYVVYIFFFIVFGLVNFTLAIPLFDVIFDTGKTKAVDSIPPFSLSTAWLQTAFYYYVNYYIRTAGKVGVLVFVSLVGSSLLSSQTDLQRLDLVFAFSGGDVLR